MLSICALASLSASVDKRLATVRKAFVIPFDELGDDLPVATCLGDHLKKMTPIESVKSKDEADVIFKVKAHLPSATTKFIMGRMGGAPSADIFAELPDGTKLWNDGAKLRRSVGSFGSTKNTGDTLECGLADELLTTLRDAMRKARDSK